MVFKAAINPHHFLVLNWLNEIRKLGFFKSASETFLLIHEKV
jgi:hypothetical protein